MTNSKTQASPKFDTRQLTVTGLMAAIICILGPLALNISVSPVPISLGSMAIYFVLTVLGMKLGTSSVLIYILLGAAGLPVFTNFTGGIGKLLGPTGGYIIGYIFMALVCGFFVDKFNNNIIINLAGMLLGTAVLYLFGSLWLAYQANMSFIAALYAGVIPYIPGDLIKLFFAVFIGRQVRKRLIKAGLINI